MGWKATETNSDTTPDTRSFYYNNGGMMTRMVNANGQTLRWNYDKLGRVTKHYWRSNPTTDVRSIQYTFDRLGRLVTVTDTDNVPNPDVVLGTWTFDPDDLDRNETIAISLHGLTPTVTLAQQFDAASNRTRLAATIGTTADFTNDYVYDYLNRLQSINQYDTAGGNVVADKRVVLRYRLNNDLNVIHRYADLGGTLQVASGTFGYDTQGRLTSLDYVQGSTNLTAYDWTYNQLNQVATFAMDVAGTTVDGTATYNYYDRTDGVRVEPGQIQSASYSPGFQASEAYSYDATGNRTMSGYSTGPVNRMTSDGVFNYTYDGEGNRDLRTRISGAPANDYTTDYDWDYQNRLTKVTFKNNSGAVTKTVEYGYDPWNNLLWRSLDADGAGAGAAVKTYFVNDGTEAVLALSPTGAVQDRYLWAPTIDQVMADEQPGTGDLLWTFTDNLGTVRELARYSGGTTTIANHRVFDSYGQLKSETNAAVDHLFAFTGRLLDEDTGLQQHLHRWYDPKVGRWLSEDPIGFDAGDVNVYRYVGNEVTNWVDAAGLERWSPYPGTGYYPGKPAGRPGPTLSGQYCAEVRCHTCTAGQEATLIAATQTACRRAHRAYYALLNFFDAIRHEYSKPGGVGMLTRMSTEGKDGQAREFYLKALRRVYECCNSYWGIDYKCLPASNWRCNTARETQLVTHSPPFGLLWPGMYVCPTFFTSADPAQLIVHELGRYCAGIWEQGTGDYETDINLWDNLIAALDGQYEYFGSMVAEPRGNR